MGTGSSSCERARELVSLRLDGELSELEARMLAVHLRWCSGCCAYASELEELAGRLRSASAEPFVRSVNVRRVPRARALQLASVAAVVAVAALAGLAGSAGSRSHHVEPAAAVDLSPRGLPTTRDAALRERPPRPVPRNRALLDV
jgi:predicted anti-sigma-YlaC factor YlaD